MIRVKDNETGKVKELADDSSLPDLVAAGKVSIPDQEYEFQDEVGDKYAVPAKSFLEAVKSGWKYRDSSIKEDERLQEKYGSSEVSALALATVRGLTFGGSDVALERSGLVSEEALREIKNRNPVSSITGEIVGNVAPIFLSGGSSLVAQAASKTLPGIIAKQATKVGARAAQNVESKLMKGVVSLGTEGVVEGAAAGVGQTVSEAELGDAEFNAETLLANVGTGALLGGALGAGASGGAHYLAKASRGALKGFKNRAVKSLDIPESEAAELLRQDASDEAIEAASRVFSENSEIADAAKRLGLSEPSIGTLSNSPITKKIESQLEDSPSIAGWLTSNKTEPFKNELRSKITGVLETGAEKTAFEAGEEVKKIVTLGVSERLRPAQDGLGTIFKTFGNFDVRERMVKMLGNRIANKDIYKLSLDGGLVDEIRDTLPKIQTLSQANLFKKSLGKRLSAEYKKPDRNQAIIDILDDTYDTLSWVEEKAIHDASMLLGPKTGEKASKKAIEIYRESMQRYRDIYKDYGPLFEQMGIKLKSADAALDNLADLPSESIQSKILSLNDYASAKQLRAKYPELFHIARGQKLRELYGNITDNKGRVSFEKFLNQVKKLTPEKRQILFGFDKKSIQKIDDLVKISGKVPEKHRSDTALNLSFMDMLNPIFQGKEALRYALYRGGDKAVRGFITKTGPSFAAIEGSSNKTKSMISSSVGSFFRASPVGVTVAAMEAFSDKELKKAEKNYELVQSNPEKLLENFTRNNQDLIESAPETANALQQRIIAGVQFLQHKTPKRDQTYIGEKPEPSRSELMKFNDYMEAVENPRVIFNQLKQGYMNPNSLEVLRTVYPKIHESIQAEVIAKMPKNLTRAQKVQLQPLLGAKITPAMDYPNLMRLQGKTPQGAAANEMATQEMNRVPAGAAQKMKSSERAQTGLARTLNRP